MEKVSENDKKNWRIVRNRVCIRALLIFLGIILMQVLAYMICMVGMTLYGMAKGESTLSMLSELSDLQEGTLLLIWVSLISALLSAVWCGILYRKSDWREKNFDYQKAFGIKNVLAICGTGIGGCVVLTMLLSVLAELVPDAFTMYNALMENLVDRSVIVTLIYVLLVGPVSEELIFRGALLDRFYLAFPFLVANLLQAALFGLYHMNLIQGLYALCLGFVLGVVRQVTGSILGSMAAHILFNTTSYGLDYLFPTEQDLSAWKLGLLVLVGLLAVACSFWYFWKVLRGQEAATVQSSWQK